MIMARHRGFVILLLAVLMARLFSLGLVQVDHPERVITMDGRTYLEAAEALLATGGFAQSPREPLAPQTVRTPGYTVFLALGQILFAGNLGLTMVLQVLVSLAPLVTAYALSTRFWSRRAGLIATWFLALDPTGFVFTQLVQTETLFAALLALALWAGVRLTEGDPPGPRLTLALGAGLALATLVRPISYYLIWPILLWFILLLRGRDTRPGRIARLVLLLLLPWVLLIGGWQVRNQLVSGSSQFSHIQAINFLSYRAAAVVAARDGLSLEQAQARLKAEADRQTNPGWPSGKRFDLYQRLGVGVLLDHPWLTIWTSIKGLGHVLLNPVDPTFFDFYGGNSDQALSLGDLWRLSWPELRQRAQDGGMVYLMANLLFFGLLLMLYAAAGIGALDAVRNDRPRLAAHLLLWLVILYLLSVSAGPEGGARFRIPMLAFLALYAGRGGDLILGRLRAQVRPARLPKQKTGFAPPP